MDSSSGNGRPHKMNRQDAKDAKEIESLENVVIGASIGYELQESTGPAEARPNKARYFMSHLQAMVADPSDPSDPSDHSRDRNRDGFPA
ncbi:MAG: hypothetical protein PHF14_09150, partial [Verrucomicrobiota bacterium]|nr:hypothetical protein [Verrucomicrobiota bacterium]